MRRLKAISKCKTEQREALLAADESKKPKTFQTTLSFGRGAESKPKSVFEEIRETKLNELNEIQFYSFNPRMLPDDVHSRPVMRTLHPRPQHE